MSIPGIRPEVSELLARWHEALIGLAVFLLGLYWVLTSFAILYWIGWLVLLIGLVLIATGIQRGRFRVGDGGPGVVQVVEGRISYFGPLAGGVVDFDALTGLDLDPRSHPPVWVLRQPGQLPLCIPLTAEGADQLFDVFAHLPGIRTEHMLRHMQAQGDQSATQPVVIWRTGTARTTHLRLH
jgi:hypothetical protein